MGVKAGVYGASLLWPYAKDSEDMLSELYAAEDELLPPDKRHKR